MRILFPVLFPDTGLSAILVAFVRTIFTMPFTIVSDHATVFRHIDTNTNLAAGMVNDVVSVAVLGTHAYVYL